MGRFCSRAWLFAVAPIIVLICTHSVCTAASPGPDSNPRIIATIEPQAATLARELLKDELQVDAATQEATDRYLVMVESASREPTDSAICGLVLSAGRLNEELGGQLGDTHDELYSLRSPAMGEEDRIERFAVNLRRVDELLPGIGLGLGAETIHHYVRYAEIAQVARQGSREQKLLKAVGSIWEDPAGWPIYVEQTTDVAGCWRPLSLLKSLREIASVWSQAPACLRDTLAPIVQHAMVHAVTTTCFCAAESDALEQVRLLATEYESLPLPGAREAAVQARDVLRGAGARFNCQ